MKKRNAFTIIEVVLVLAIAGLIFLMVFIALPALQRSQRNTRRRQDISRIASAVTSYYSANGKMPFMKSGRRSYSLDYDFIKNYIDSNISENGTKTQNAVDFSVSCQNSKTCDQFSDPNGNVYQISLGNADSTWTDMNKIFFNASTKCGNNGLAEKISGGTAASMFSVHLLLEGGAVYCVDNS